MKELKNTSIATVFIAAVKPQGWLIEPDEIDIPFCSAIKAISEFLAIKKNKEQNIAIEVKDLRDEPVLIAKVSCHLPEDENESPNWTYEMAFNKDDIDLSDAKVYSATDLGFYEILNRCTRKDHGFEYLNNSAANTMLVTAFKVLKQWLDENAVESEPVSVGCEGYFVATVAVENGEKVFAITPDGPCKTLIKDDEQLAE